MLVEWTRAGKVADAQSLRQEATPGTRVPTPHALEYIPDPISEVTPWVACQHLLHESRRQEVETYTGDVDQGAGSDEVVEIAGAKRDIDVEVHGDRLGDSSGIAKRSTKFHQCVRSRRSRDGEAWLLNRRGGPGRSAPGREGDRRRTAIRDLVPARVERPGPAPESPVWDVCLSHSFSPLVQSRAKLIGRGETRRGNSNRLRAQTLRCDGLEILALATDRRPR